LTRPPRAPYLGRVNGKTAVVTGATSSIGRVTARELARAGARVVVVARDVGRGQASVDEIRRDTKNDDVSVMLCDLASQASIRRFAADFRARFDRLHVLVNNAAVILGERRVTEDGLEATFSTNHLAYFLLTKLLLGALEASAPARIVSVASEVHRAARLEWDDLQFERRPYTPMAAYGQSKLANVVWNAELARRLHGTGVTANCLHPGVIASNIGTAGPGWMRLGMKLVSPLLMTPEKGAATSLYLATSPAVKDITGAYFVRKKPRATSTAARDPSAGLRLWAVCEELTGETAAAA
jgi:NAD(P)-dependent dehydrogenase (short-subunit alcohol dehydrogenase family)